MNRLDNVVYFLLIAVIFHAEPFFAQTDAGIEADSTFQKKDSLSLVFAENLNKMANLISLFQPHDKYINKLFSPGRVFTRQWFDADGYSAYPVNKRYDGDGLFDPFSIPADLSLLPADEHRMDISGGDLNIFRDSVKVRRPYTNLYYQIGSYQYKNLFVRHRQVLGKWSLDFHGQNSGGVDGHPYSNGSQANIYGSVVYTDSRKTSFEMQYEAWRSYYRYNPYYPDSSIVRQSKDKALTDRWTLKRIWSKNKIERSEAGISYAGREGHWTPAKTAEQAFNYKTYSGFFKIKRIYWANPLSLGAQLNFYSGRTRKGEIDGTEYSLIVNADYLMGNRENYSAWFSMSGGVLPGFAYGKVNAKVNIRDFLFLRAGTGLIPRYDRYGVYNKQSFANTWVNARVRILKANYLNIFFGAVSNYYSGISWPLAGQNRDSEVSNRLSILAKFDLRYLQINLKVSQKITGFEQIPDQQAELEGKFRFRLISRLYIDSGAILRYAHNYKQFEFDLDNYLLSKAGASVDNSLQLDLKIAAQIKTFEIYYQGIHLDAFLVDNYDFAPIKGFAQDLPRFRIGIKWVLFN